MKKIFPILVAIILLTGVTGCSHSAETPEGKRSSQQEKKVELTVSAAASLQDSLKELKKKFEKKHPSIRINFNFGASGALQQQISQGAPVDLFFSADQDKFSPLVKDGLIQKQNSTNLIGNKIVLVVPKASDKKITSFKQLNQANKISIGIPESVPAGKYGKESLIKLKVWNSIKEKIVYAKDVRQVLTYVETRNVDAGIVYRTDAVLSSKVKIAETAEDKSHSPIIYPLGVLEKSKHLKEAKMFYTFLKSESSVKTFKKYGFKDLK
jgi:molybdate transport system substrate-binding protein